MADERAGQIVNVMKEERLFPPSAEFSAQARIDSMEAVRGAVEGGRRRHPRVLGQDGRRAALVQAVRQGARVERAVRQVVRRRADERLLQLPRRPPRHARGATRRPSSGKASRATSACCTYQMLHHEVCKFANVLKKLGVGKGDVVSIYMPMIPELAIAMLACARIGAVHSRDLRRLLRRGDRRPQQRRQGQAA